jgi:hypothetical protein
MKTSLLLAAAALAAATLLGGCNDNNSPRGGEVVTDPPPSVSISDFVASLIAKVTGSSCDTATPDALDSSSVTLTEDMDAKDANALAVNCNS